MADRKNNKSRGQVTSIKESIDQFIDAYSLRQGYDLSALKTIWREVMGQTVSSRTSQIFYRDNKLLVKIESAPLKHQLTMNRSLIKDRLNEAMGRPIIEEVAFL